MAVKLEINITNKWLYILAAIGFILAIGVQVYAYGTSNPNMMGHSGDEIMVTFDGEQITLNEAINIAGRTTWENTWIPYSPQALPYYQGEENMITYDLPSEPKPDEGIGAVPLNAREILILISFEQEGAGSASCPWRTWNTVAKEPTTGKAYYSSFYVSVGGGPKIVNSDTFWLPVTSERKFYSVLSAGPDYVTVNDEYGNPTQVPLCLNDQIPGTKSGVYQIIGYR